MASFKATVIPVELSPTTMTSINPIRGRKGVRPHYCDHETEFQIMNHKVHDNFCLAFPVGWLVGGVRGFRLDLAIWKKALILLSSPTTPCTEALVLPAQSLANMLNARYIHINKLTSNSLK